MGHGIAQIAAAAGYQTTLYDVNMSVVEQGLLRIHRNLEKAVELGKATSQECEDTLARLHMSSDLDRAVHDAEIVIEAVPELMDVKQGLFKHMEQAITPETIIASNTSSLSITDLASVLKRPERCVGLHFFNPVHIMKLVEVVWGEETSEETRERAMRISEEFGKVPILVKDSPGFASSRLGIVLGMEAIRMVEDGVASAEDIDKAMELGYRHPMGPLRLTDLVGLDVRLSIAMYLHRTLGSEAFRPPELLKRMVAEGTLGQKSGEGFYTWDEDE
jgi:3-hydroxybutyryl-CoA dehydrogenase